MDDDATAADVQCLGRYLRGEQAGFAQIYDRHDRACYEFIRRLIVPPDDAAAEDIHQEVWLAVARQAHSFDATKARFVTWLYTIARNRAMDHLRQRSSQGRWMTPDADEGLLAAVPADPGWQPEEQLHQQRMGVALAAQLQALPLAQRETFVLFALDDLSLDEVATITQVGIETAKTRLRYARSALRAKLSGWKVHHG